jgi:hypothetical protein
MDDIRADWPEGAFRSRWLQTDRNGTCWCTVTLEDHKTRWHYHVARMLRGAHRGKWRAWVGSGKDRESLGRRYADRLDAEAICEAHMRIAVERLGQTLADRPV